MRSKVFILLPVHNRCAITERFVECLLAQTYTNYHLVLIDDGSVDGTSEMVKGRINSLTVLTGSGDWWWAGALQRGIDWLKQNAGSDDLVLFVNDDVSISSEFLQRGVEILDQVGGLLLAQVMNKNTGCIQETGIESNLRKLSFETAKSAERINCLPTRGLFMQMKTLKIIGDFYPRLLPHYLSDYEFTIRAYKKGISLATSPKLIISFDESTSGYRTFHNLSMREYLKRKFSIKSVSNPIYWTSFIFLTAPKLTAPLLIARVWIGAVKEIFVECSLNIKTLFSSDLLKKLRTISCEPNWGLLQAYAVIWSGGILKTAIHFIFHNFGRG